MFLKLTKEQEELFIKNYEEACTRIAKLHHSEKAVSKVFLLECDGDMLSLEVEKKIRDEMITDTLKATMEFMLK